MLKMTKMKIRQFLRWTLAFVLCAGVFSCKDKKDDSTVFKKTLSGMPEFSIPAYVSPGDVLDLVPATVKTEDEKLCGIYWAFSFSSSVRDTTRLEGGTGDAATRLVVPDTLKTFSVTCAAFAEGYYNVSSSIAVTVVNGQETFTGMDLPEDAAFFTDPRDGRTYPYVTIGDREWFARNLAHEGGASYRDADAMQDVFGQYYSWDEALEACPDGWRLPTAEDWTALAVTAGVDAAEGGVYRGLAGRLMADAYMNDKKMWEFYPEVKLTNDMLFYAIPVGYATDAEGLHTFYGSSEYAIFWTAEEADEELAYCRQLYVSSPDVLKGALHKASFLASVRCVRDVEQ